MSIPLFFAMTGDEIQKVPTPPPKIAWMSCHFSPYGPGLVDLPRRLPPGSMLILDDRIPLEGHSPTLIANQLVSAVMELHCSYLLLDLQRGGAESLVSAILDSAPCPVGVPPAYARALDCPVFLPPVPPNITMEAHLHPWQGRQIWLELALDGVDISVTGTGTHATPVPFPSSPAQAHYDAALSCHYSIAIQPEEVRFSLLRTIEDVASLLDNAQQYNVTLAAGLFQELKSLSPQKSIKKSESPDWDSQISDRR